VFVITFVLDVDQGGPKTYGSGCRCGSATLIAAHKYICIIYSILFRYNSYPYLCNELCSRCVRDAVIWIQIRAGGKGFFSKLLYLRHIETNDELHHGDHDVDDRGPPFVKQLTGLPGSLMPAGTLCMDFESSSDSKWFLGLLDDQRVTTRLLARSKKESHEKMRSVWVRGVCNYSKVKDNTNFNHLFI